MNTQIALIADASGRNLGHIAFVSIIGMWTAVIRAESGRLLGVGLYDRRDSAVNAVRIGEAF